MNFEPTYGHVIGSIVMTVSLWILIKMISLREDRDYDSLIMYKYWPQTTQKLVSLHTFRLRNLVVFVVEFLIAYVIVSLFSF